MKRAIATAMWLVMTCIAAPATLSAGEAGDAVFADRGPWDLKDRPLTWSLHVEGPEKPGFLHVDDGSVALGQTIDPSDQKPVLQITQKTDSRTRKIGPFPISGGDPVLIFFLEQTARDMAGLTGGSPHYIRNRIKDAVFRGGQITRDDDGATAVFQPFENDPNAERMQGFQSLRLTFMLSDDPKAPIRELRAETADTGPGYVNRMVLQ
ncbi:MULTISPECIES: hypothetical protein [unclassified Paracoccus (in: a-proteobacteria)]|uniref:hypothetical protein n=1 Tax=unclassified Paracoccus (in: a-proteobacteria) TaxID=2688777 RepID=UPI001FFE1551|nr:MULTISPECIES: hypothetical protein [unclassified Paracoccus (in: a-proteobacteria)]